MLIFLVGFMGSGKTTVGLALAERLGLPFVDLDTEIERSAGMPIRDIFRDHGEAGFRGLERDELRRICGLERGIIALGGGAYCSEENQSMVRDTGRCVWLDAPIDVLFRRCGGDPSRPLATGYDGMARLLETRRPFYEKADIRVDARQTVELIVAEILENGPFCEVGSAANRDQ